MSVKPRLPNLIIDQGRLDVGKFWGFDTGVRIFMLPGTSDSENKECKLTYFLLYLHVPKDMHTYSTRIDDKV